MPTHQTTESAMADYDEYDTHRDEEMREIYDEAMEYAANVHRADEDGWFYPDDDGESQ
jgi:hypothetical protein